MLATPLTARETSQANPVSPGMQLGICFAVTKFDAVFKRLTDQSFRPMYSNLPACLGDCLDWQQTLLKFGTKQNDIFFLHNPMMKEWHGLVKALNQNIKPNPDKVVLLMHCYAGHGMCMEGRQVLLLNEFNPWSKFYKFLAVEQEIRNLAKKFRHCFNLCIMACCREIFLKDRHTNGFSRDQMLEILNLKKRGIKDSFQIAMAKKFKTFIKQQASNIEVKQKLAKEKFEEQEARGSTLIEREQQNFCILFGCSPATGVQADTTMVFEVGKALLDNIDWSTLSVIIPQALEELAGKDAKFEVAQSSSITPLRLMFKQNLVEKSQAVIFEFTNKPYDGLSKSELNDVYLPQIFDYLRKVFRVGSKIHRFTNLRPSQIVEKLDWLHGQSMRFSRLNGKDPYSQGIFYQVVINLGYFPSQRDLEERIPPILKEKGQALDVKATDNTSSISQFVFVNNDKLTEQKFVDEPVYNYWDPEPEEKPPAHWPTFTLFEMSDYLIRLSNIPSTFILGIDLQNVWDKVNPGKFLENEDYCNETGSLKISYGPCLMERNGQQMISLALNHDDMDTMGFIYKMKDEVPEYESKQAYWVQDWWSTDFKTLSQDEKQTILIDKRPKEVIDLVKANRSKSTVKLDFWQMRLQMVKRLQSISDDKNRLYHLKSYFLAVTLGFETEEPENEETKISLDDCDLAEVRFRPARSAFEGGFESWKLELYSDKAPYKFIKALSIGRKDSEKVSLVDDYRAEHMKEDSDLLGVLSLQTTVQTRLVRLYNPLIAANANQIAMLPDGGSGTTKHILLNDNLILILGQNKQQDGPGVLLLSQQENRISNLRINLHPEIRGTLMPCMLTASPIDQGLKICLTTELDAASQFLQAFDGATGSNSQKTVQIRDSTDTENQLQPFLISEWTVLTDQLLLQVDKTSKKSVLVKSDVKPDFLKEIAPQQLMVQVTKTGFSNEADFLILETSDDWNIQREIRLKSNLEWSDQMNLLPGFNPETRPFFIKFSAMFDEDRTAKLVDLRTNQKSALFQQSPDCMLFKMLGTGHDMHYLQNRKLGEQAFDINWHCWHFSGDFLESLENHGLPPTNLSYEELQEKLAQNESQKQQILDLKEHIRQKDEQINAQNEEIQAVKCKQTQPKEHSESSVKEQKQQDLIVRQQRILLKVQKIARKEDQTNN